MQKTKKQKKTNYADFAIQPHSPRAAYEAMILGVLELGKGDNSVMALL